MVVVEAAQVTVQNNKHIFKPIQYYSCMLHTSTVKVQISDACVFIIITKQESRLLTCCIISLINKCTGTQCVGLSAGKNM